MRELLKIASLLVLFTACEKEIMLDLPQPEEYIVVEGHIEQDLPPYVILTRSTPFFTPTNINTIGETFVHNAIVVVSDGSNTVQLEELYFDSIPESLIDFVENTLSFDLPFNDEGFEGLGFSLYTNFDMIGEIGRGYSLEILAEGKKITSFTTIPKPIELDSVWTTPHPDPKNDTLVTLYARYTDVPGQRNYVRYLTQRNFEFPYPSLIQSVFDDFTIFNVDGKSIDIPLERGQSRFGEADFETYSYFTKGDDIILKWCAIDAAHYDFWITMEFDRNQTGNPFGRPTVVKTNINGGLGIWGGYGASYYQITAE